MHVEEQAVFGGRFREAVGEIGDLLVVAVEEIDLEALDAHLRVVFADAFEVAFRGIETGPEDDAHAAFLAVGDQFGQVDRGNDLEKVGLFVHGPAFVEDDVFDAVVGGEVDVVFIGFVVDSRLEVHAVEVPGVPPVPGHLAGFDPRNVLHARGCGETVDHVVVGQLDVASGDGEDAPREGAGPRGAGDEVLALGHQQLQFVVAALHLLGRIGREVAPEGLAARGVVEVHARVVLQVGLGDDDFRRSGVCQDRQEGQAVVGDLRDGLGGVGVFEAVEVVAGQPRFLLAVAGVGDQRREVLRETDVHQLVRNGDFVLHRGAEPVGRAVVIGPEVDAVIPFERKRQRVVSVLDGAALVKGRFDDFVDAFCRRLAHRGFAAEHAPVGERERKGRGGDQLFAVARNGVGDGVGADIHAYGDFPVGGFQIVGFGCGNSGPGTE